MPDPKPRVRSTVGVAGSVVRVSAPLRRGAAPYADGSLRSQAPSYLIFLLNLSGSGAGTRGDLRDILCTTQWRKKFPLVTLRCRSSRKVTYSKGSGPAHDVGYMT